MKRLTSIVKRFLLGLVRDGTPAAASPVPSIPVLAEFTDEDKDQLLKFFQSVTGKKVRDRLQVFAYRRAMDEAKAPAIEKQAAGYEACRVHLLSLCLVEIQKPAKAGVEEELTVEERLSP